MTDLIVDALACFRLTHLTASDILLEEPRDAITEWASRTHHRKVRYFATCPWCQGIWWAAFVVGARRTRPREWDVVARGLALAAVAGIISSSVEH